MLKKLLRICLYVLFANPYVFATACVFNSAHQGSGAAGDQTCNLTWAGYTRSIILHIPSTVANGSALVLSFHGVPDTAANWHTTSGLRPNSDTNGYVFVTPAGWFYNTTERWQDYGGERDRAQNSAPFTDDSGFARYIVSQVQAGMAAGSFSGGGITLDPKKTYAIGFSAGAAMVDRLIAEDGDIFAAATSANIQAGSSATLSNAQIHPSPLIGPTMLISSGTSVCKMLGDADATTSYCGLITGGGFVAVSADMDLYHFQSAMGTSINSGNPSYSNMCTAFAGSITSVEQIDSSSTANIGRIRMCRIQGGTHQWYANSIATTTCASPSSNSETQNQIMWDWFTAHPYATLPAPIVVNTYPLNPLVNMGSSWQRLGCKINGSYTSDVTWSIMNTGGCGHVSGSTLGTISSDGYFVAPSSVPFTYGFDYCVAVCTSNADPTEFNWSWISVSNPTNFSSPSLSGTLTDGVVGTNYTAGTITESGLSGTAQWSVDGSLPSGLTGCTGTGTSCTISGTPTTPGTYLFSVTVVDGSNVRTMSQYFSMNITSAGSASIIFTGSSTTSGGVLFK